MGAGIKEELRAQPGLDGHKPRHVCKVCRSYAVFFDFVDFNKVCHPTNFYVHGVKQISVPYYSCPQCECIFTPAFDAWTKEDFAEFIYNDEYNRVDPDYIEKRPAVFADLISSKLGSIRDARILDYGSGMGVFAERMREVGFANVESYDPFSFPKRPAGKFDLVTAFEVVEHSTDPNGIFADMKSFSTPEGVILISQCIQPKNIHSIKGSWWYLGPRNGHVTTYSTATLTEIAKGIGTQVHMLQSGLFCFSEDPVDSIPRAVLRAFRPYRSYMSLYAPGPGEEARRDQWYGREPGRLGPFRWTASNVLDFGEIDFEEGETELDLSYFLEIEPGFAQGAKWRVNGDLPTTVEGNKISGTFKTDRPVRAPVQLITRAPSAPKNPSDRRQLGLAVRMSLE